MICHKIFVTEAKIAILRPLAFHVYANAMHLALLPEAHANEGADYPFVLVDGDVFVVEEGVAHHEGGSGKVAQREVIDDGCSLVE